MYHTIGSSNRKMAGTRLYKRGSNNPLSEGWILAGILQYEIGRMPFLTSLSLGSPLDVHADEVREHLEEKGFLAWTVDVHAIPKPTRDPYAVADLSKPSDVYYVYVCTKNEKLDNEKDLKKKHQELLKKGKKIKKKGPGRKR